MGVISWAGGAVGRRERTDQVGLERRAVISSPSLGGLGVWVEDVDTEEDLFAFFLK